MGIFGRLGRIARDGSLSDGLAAAQATVHGDYAGAANIRQNGAARRAKSQEQEAEAAQMQQIYSAIDADSNLPTPEAKAWARMNPKAYAQVMLSRFETRQFGPGGGSVMTPGGAGPQWQMAPSRMEYQGSVADIGPTVPGQRATVTPQHEGTQWITPQPGTNAFPVNSVTGAARSGGASAPGHGSPAPVLTDEDILRLDAQGGAGRSAPRTFPVGY